MINIIIDPKVLRSELGKTLKEIDLVIDEVKAKAAEMNGDAHKLRDGGGNWVLPPLLCAKAQTLHALTLINERKR